MKNIIILMSILLLFSTCKKEEDTNTPTNNNTQPSIILSSTDVVVQEGVGTSSITIKLGSKPYANVCFQLFDSMLDETPVLFGTENDEPGEYTEIYFTPSNYNQPQKILFLAVDDNISEQTMYIQANFYGDCGSSLSIDTNYANIAQNYSINITLHDND